MRANICNLSKSLHGNFNIEPENIHRRGRIKTVDLLIKIGCFVKKGKNIVSV
jgi:hypothetical protein